MAETNPTLLAYYVYGLFDHRGNIFYIGKGKGYRAWCHASKPPTSERNRWRRNIVLKTIRILGSCPTVIIREGLCEAEAFEIEIALIKAIGRRDLGTGPLVNMTDGGEGKSGPRQYSDETRQRLAENMRIRATGVAPTEEVRAKLSAALKGRKRPPGFGQKIGVKLRGRKRTPEQCARIKAAAQNRPQSWRDNLSKANLGKTLSAEHRAKIGAAGVGRNPSTETRAKIGARHKGKVVSPETRQKMSDAAKRRRAREQQEREVAAQDAPTPRHDKERQYLLPL